MYVDINIFIFDVFNSVFGIIGIVGVMYSLVLVNVFFI